MKASLAVAGILAMLGIAKQADACGGCFHLLDQPPGSESVVTGHRMVFTVSEGRTVLWDQIQYSGSPKEFAWVLPIRPGAYVEQSTDAWFEVLEAVTKTTVGSPNVICNYPNYSYGYGGDYSGGSSHGCGCGFSSSEDSAASPQLGAAVDAGLAGGPAHREPPPVEVIHQGTVGPYETVTLSSKDGSALRKWLGDHGFAVPVDIDPVIDTYVSEGADFIALRLRPGFGVNAMTPVRVVTPKGPPILPLRMVAAGTGPFVDIVLYIIAESRYGLTDLTESHVDLAKLSYDFDADKTNYSLLRDQALQESNGFTFLSTYATRSAFTQPVVAQSISGIYGGDIPSLYFAQTDVDDGRDPQLSRNCSVTGFASDKLVVEAPRPVAARDAGPSGPSVTDGGRSAEAGPQASDAGGATRDARATAPQPSAPDATLAPNEISSADLTCEGHGDVAAALIGMHPSKVWLTRLEMNLPHEALMMDCHAAPSSDGPVPNAIRASKYTGDPCPGGTVATDASPSFAPIPWAAGFLTLLGLFRRRNRT
jgi:hypothetical protein